MYDSYARGPSEPGVEGGQGVRQSDTDDRESPDAKRRKIRKGTRSCWECKRRKIRCNFASAADAICIGCQRRRTHCLSQEYPEEESRPAERGQQIGDRIVRVEALVEQLVRKVGNGSPSSEVQRSPFTTITPSSKATPAERDEVITASYTALPTPCPSDIESTQLVTYCNVSPANHQSDVTDPPFVHRQRIEAATAVGPTPSAKLLEVSRQLHAALPSAELTRFICNSVGGFALYFHQMLTRTTSDFDIELATAEQCAGLPSPNAHPVIIARYMLNMAEYLQYLPNEQSIIDRLGEKPGTMMKRLADTAISLVTTNEEFMGTIENLECIILEGAYQANSGNLRRSWLAFRRASVVAQLMGCHRRRIPTVKTIEPTTKADPRFMWYRINFADRYLCLMLGLPPGSLDDSFASDEAMAKEPAMGKLERTLTSIALRVLQRNEGAPDKCSGDETQSIDLALQKAAKLMPSRWWLPPNLSQMAQNPDQSEIFWETLRLMNQIFYYSLLNQLHLPYMLMFSTEKQLVYSKLACITASREVLSRFITFRTWNQVAFCCRSVDFFALMAAMTLVLAHLHANDEPDLNCLAHQRHSDRAMMEQVLESMESVYKLNMDVLSEKSGDLLRRLLEIEADAAEGRRYKTHFTNCPSGLVPTAENGGEDDACVKPGPCPKSDEEGAMHVHEQHGGDDEPGVLRMCIPYFGVIRIAREGGISREEAGGLATLQQPLGIVGVGDGESLPGSSDPDSMREERPLLQAGSQVALQQQGQMVGPQQDFGGGGYAAGNALDPALLGQEFPYPGLAASADDWAFQGVDMNFFESLMKGMAQNGGNVQQQPDGGASLFAGGGW